MGGFEKHCTRASLRSDTVEDLIRLSVEGPSLEDVDARESVARWFSQGQRSRKLNYRSWPFRGACELQWRIVHNTLSHEIFSLTALKTLNLDCIYLEMF